MLSRLQLETAVLERLGQGRASVAKPAEPPDFVFYTGCNVLKTPHIALLALDIMDRLGVSYQVMGGPSHCCGILQLRAGDVEMSGRMGSASIEKLSHSEVGPGAVVVPELLRAVHRDDAADAREAARRAALRDDAVPPLPARPARRPRPHLREPVELRVALHQHPGVAGVMEAATDILQAVPGVTLVDLEQPAVGLQSVYLAVLPAYRRELELRRAGGGARCGRRCAGDGLSFRSSLAVRA